MELSAFFAKIFGIYFIVTGIAALAKSKEYTKLVKDFMSNRALVYVAGVVMLAIGLILVMKHNLWDGGWRVVITIVSWLILLKGAVYILLPHDTLVKWAQIKNKRGWFSVGGLILALIGVYLLMVSF